MKLLLSLIIAFQMAFVAPLYAIEIQLQKSLNLRSLENEYVGNTATEFKYLKNLPAGTVLEIPDEYIVKKNGQLNAQATLNNWLEKGENVGVQSEYYDLIDKKVKLANFFKVKVISLPSGYAKDPNYTPFVGYTGYMALGKIAKSGGISMINTQKADIIFSDSEVQKIETAQAAKRIEASTCTNCEPALATDSNLIRELKSDLSPILDSLMKRASKNVRLRPLKTVVKNFEKYCYGVKFEDYKKYLQQKSVKNGVPAEVMLGIMTQESPQYGCASIGPEKNGSKSVGLLQVNTDTKSTPLCTKKQLKELRSLNGDLIKMESGPICLQNPAVNTQLGIEVYIDKYVLTNGHKPTYDGKGWINQTNEIRDEHRRAVSGYNGGQDWVNLADKELATAAQKLGMEFTPKDLKTWKFTRLIMFHRQLEENTDIYNKYGLNVMGKNSRTAENNLINMSYVDAVTGRNESGLPYQDLASQWGEELGFSRKE